MVDRKKKEVQDLKEENQDLRTTVTQLFDTLEEVETELLQGLEKQRSISTPMVGRKRRQKQASINLLICCNRLYENACLLFLSRKTLPSKSAL